MMSDTTYAIFDWRTGQFIPKSGTDARFFSKGEALQDAESYCKHMAEYLKRTYDVYVYDLAYGGQIFCKYSYSKAHFDYEDGTLRKLRTKNAVTNLTPPDSDDE